MNALTVIYSMYKVPHLTDDYPDDDQHASNLRPIDGDKTEAYSNYMGSGDVVLGNIVRSSEYPTNVLTSFVRAGPRKFTYFNGSDACAAIVTCGGVCPGMNAVIRAIYKTLRYDYGCERVYGVVGGFGGFFSTTQPPTLLTEERVSR